MRSRTDWVTILERHATYQHPDDDRLWIDIQEAADLILDNEDTP